MIEAYEAVVKRLSAKSCPELELKIHCDTNDTATAHKILGPLYNLPPLNSLAIRLSKIHNEPLQELAEKTLVRMTRNAPSVNPIFHRYNELPKELRLHVLAHTNLVSDIVTTD